MSSHTNTPESTHIPRRPPEQVMRLDRMGSAHQGRLSFMRTLLRRIKRENWAFERTLWEIDEQGVGRAVYQAQGPQHSIAVGPESGSLTAHSFSKPPTMGSIPLGNLHAFRPNKTNIIP